MRKRWKVVNPVNGRKLREFKTESDARHYCSRHMISNTCIKERNWTRKTLPCDFTGEYPRYAGDQ